MQYDLMILGAGSAGLAVAGEASSVGLRCVAIDCQGSPAYASVRNQGWLHTGALWASRNAKGSAALVEACRNARKLLHELDEELSLKAIRSEPGLFVYPGRSELDTALAALQMHGVEANVVGREQLSVLAPILGNDTSFYGGLLTGDLVVDAPAILNGLLGRARRTGCDIRVARNCKHFGETSLTKAPGGWRFKGGDIDATAARVVCTLGAFIPHAVKATCNADLDFKVANTCVLGVEATLCRGLVSLQDMQTGLMNIAPAPFGTTVNLGTQSNTFFDPTMRAIEQAVLVNILDRLEEFAPGIRRHLPLRATFYVCQKLEPGGSIETSRGHRNYIAGTVAEGLYFLYPGKFTFALPAARDFVADLKGDVPIGAPAATGNSDEFRFVSPIGAPIDGSVVGTLDLVQGVLAFRQAP